MAMHSMVGVVALPSVSDLVLHLVLGLLGGGVLMMICARSIGKSTKATYLRSVGTVALAGLACGAVLAVAALFASLPDYADPKQAVFTALGVGIVVCLAIWISIIKAMFSISLGRAILAYLPMLVASGLAVLAEVAAFEQSVASAKQSTARILCENNLRKIGSDLMIFSGTNQGKWPPSLYTLKAWNSADRQLFTCPCLEGRHVGRGFDYFYQPLQDAANPGTIVACDFADNHSDGSRNVLFADGDVHTASPAEFQTLLALPVNVAFAQALQQAEQLRARDREARQSSKQDQATAEQDRAAKSLGIPKELSLDLGGDVNMKLVLIPAGKFTMGSSKAEQAEAGDEKAHFVKSDKSPEEIYANEGPAHEVTLTRPFYLGIYEVTRGQFAAFVADTEYKTDAEKEGKAWGMGGRSPALMEGYSWKKIGFDQTDNHPVLNVSWNDAMQFCKWLSRKSGRTVAMPTEAQWEYACRGGTMTCYFWGDYPDDGNGWCNVSDQTTKEKSNFLAPFNFRDGYAVTAPAGQFKPNGFGLYDMIGNAGEWCSDRYAESYAHANDRDATGSDSGTRRVMRGGCWGDIPSDCRCASRGGREPNASSLSGGFRVAVDVK